MQQTSSTRADLLADAFRQAKVIPVITFERLDDAVPLANALIEGGIRFLEITLRSAVALQAAAEIIKRVPEAYVGIGTVLTADDLKKAKDIGARFALSPGATPELLDAAAASDLPFAPGIATASELMAARQRGFDLVKFFPASTSGGKDGLRALRGPFPNTRFCPTGGIGEGDFADWLTLPGVLAVGGSWLTPADDIRNGAWSAITERAKRTVAKIPA